MQIPSAVLPEAGSRHVILPLLNTHPASRHGSDCTSPTSGNHNPLHLGKFEGLFSFKVSNNFLSLGLSATAKENEQLLTHTKPPQTPVSLYLSLGSIAKLRASTIRPARVEYCLPTCLPSSMLAFHLARAAHAT